ncbi:hypothetical protein D3C85_1522740 [compost metagenome]
MVLRKCLALAPHDHLICLISDFAGTTAQTTQLMRQLSAHNDVIALQVYDPLALAVPERGRLLITQGQLQVELEVDRHQVRKPLGDYLSGRLKDVASLLRGSQVPLMMIDTGKPALDQVRNELGRLAAVAR